MTSGHDPDRHDSGPLSSGVHHLALEGAVTSGALERSLAWVLEHVPADGVRRVADLGAGTGAGSLGLARRFEGADVVAVDREAGALEDVAGRALRAGLAGRLRTVVADLDRGWPDGLDRLDLTWASEVTHHLADPDAFLRRVLAAAAEGGFLALVEGTRALQLLGDVEGLQPDLEARAVGAARRAHGIVESEDTWGERLARAGWTVVDELDVDLGADLTDEHLRAAARLARQRVAQLAAHAPDDLGERERRGLADLERGVEDGSIDLSRHLRVRGRRAVTLARR